MTGVAVGTALLAVTQSASAEERALSLYNAHTKESATIVYKRDGRFVSSGLSELNRFLRDWRRNQPTKMDPQLFDILWEVYRQAGATRPITVICGYRSAETNAMLRRRSKGVANNSLHVKGQAIDFYIPGVDLAKMRAIGLRMQAGGVGYYPSSGSPFVHMDTGSVRHWPRMSRSQLVKVFPDGKTLHVPSDGKPLPGYAQALAAYKMRQARGIAVANAGAVPSGATIASIAPEDVPLPRLSPDRAAPVLMASAVDTGSEEARSLLSYPATARVIDGSRFSERFAADSTPPRPSIRQVAFEAAHSAGNNAPEDLIAALVDRYGDPEPAVPSPTPSRTASLPIKPTAVVATVEVGGALERPFRADAITTAVLLDNADRLDTTVPPVLAYASAAAGPDTVDTSTQLAAADMPMPQTNPVRQIEQAPAPVESAVPAISKPADLTLTKLDTQSLRLWIAAPLTQERRYALLTLPAIGPAPEFLSTTVITSADGFNATFSDPMPTDRFNGTESGPDAGAGERPIRQILAAR